MVTVVITTCKRKTEIVKRAIQSVVAQTYDQWELLIIDDSPKDFPCRDEIRETAKVFAQTHPVRYIANSVNSGACYSRNVGICEAQGQYIAFLDDDDEWMPEKLTQQIQLMDNCQDVALVYSPFIQINETTAEQSMPYFLAKNGMLYEDLMRQGNFIGGTSIPLMRLSCVKAVGSFDEKMQSAQDFDLWLRLAKRYKIVSTTAPNVLYYMHEGEQISTNPNKKIAGIERLVEKNAQYITKHRDVDARYCRSLSWYYKSIGNSKKSYLLWLQAVKRKPQDLLKNMKQLILNLRTK